MSDEKDLGSSADTKQDTPEELSLGDKLDKMFAEAKEAVKKWTDEDRAKAFGPHWAGK